MNQSNKENASKSRTYNTQDMALLHHFTISTSQALARDRGLQKFYQITAVQLGLSDPFVLHGILAIASLHLSQTQSENRQEYHAVAAKHHDIALAGYQQALQEDLGPQRYDAIFISASLLFIFIFAYVQGGAPDARSPQDDAVEIFLSFHWVRIARGIRVLRKQGQQWLPSSPLWAVMHKTLAEWPINIDPETNKNVYDLDPPCPQENLLAALGQMWLTDSEIDQERAKLCSDALDSLTQAYRRAHQRHKESRKRQMDNGNDEFVQSLGWLAQLSDGFINLLEQHYAPALVLMCHYTKLLDSPSFSFWWTHRNSQICTSRIQRILPLSWHQWLNLH
jgi:hypothetical protein